MLSEKMLKGLNEQITKELYSGYLYLEMAAFFEDQNLAGAANWMRVQAQEETAHAMIFFNYVKERGGRVRLGAIAEPPHDYKSMTDVFEQVLAHEQTVTASINRLMDLAIAEKDYATQRRLDWFITEQVEEEANPTEILGKLRLTEGHGNALFMIDRELGARTFAMPEPLAAGAGAPA